MAADRRTPFVAVAALTLAAALAAAQPVSRPKHAIAHRGASSYAPEHTLAAYRLAIEQRADYVEQDLAVTRDGVLICLHDDTLQRTSDVATVFPDRFAAPANGAKPGRGRDWLANDFTLAEIRRLDMGRWFGEKFAGERIVTWEEAVDLVRGRAGLYPELKSPPLYTARGVDMVALFVASVRRKGLDRPDSLQTTPMIVQSFDEATIKRLAKELPAVPRILLLDVFPPEGLTDARLRDIATFAGGIGPAKDLVQRHPDVVRRAHGAGLTVTAYTFRARNTGGFPSVRQEMAHHLHTLGVDGVFTDNPDQFPR